MRRPVLPDLPAPPPGKTGWPWTEGSPPLPDTLPDGQPWPRVSIVTPSFNQGGFIEETIRSVLLQGYPNLEYLVVDGGSTDDSVEIIRKYEPWLTYWVSEPDQGQADAINKGWRRATGEIITWLNSDDTYCPGGLGKGVGYLMAHPDVDVVYGSLNCIDPQGRVLGVMRAWPFDLRRQLTGRNLVWQQASFARRSMLDRVGYLDLDLNYVFDYEWWNRMLLLGSRFLDVPDVLANFRFHHTSKTVGSPLAMAREHKAALDRIYDSDATPKFVRPWRGRAYSTYHRIMGSVYYRYDQMSDARQEFWASIARAPFQPASGIAVAYLLDSFLGTRLGPFARRLRSKLPDVPKDSLFVVDGDAEFLL